LEARRTVEPAVFIVDDDEAVRDSLRLLLETHGRAVKAFASGAAILESPPEAAAGCLILDYHMPLGNGLDVLDQLRARQVTLPAILITGLSDARMAQRADKAGVLAVLQKPFPDHALLDAVECALRSAPGPVGPRSTRHT